MEENVKKMKSFETLIYTDQTLKVSLTPDRLVTIETHKPLPKLAPREPVARDSLISKSLPKPPGIEEEVEDEEDIEILGRRPQKENLYEFLKNSSPEDYKHKNKVSQKGDISSRRRGKPFDKLDTVSEISKSPGSPRHTPLIPSAKSTSSLGSPFSLASPRQQPAANSSLHHSKSLDFPNNIKNVGSPVKQKKPGQLNLYNDINDEDSDDEFGVDGKRRRRPTQDLIDFLKTTPPSEKTTFPDSVKDSNYNTNGKKMETKIRKIFSILKMRSSSDDSNYSSSGNSLNSANSTFSTSSTSTATLVTKQRARFIKIEIPPLPPLPPKDNNEQTGFLGVQGKNTHQLPKAKSTSNLPHVPSKTNPDDSSNSLTKVTATLDGKHNELQVSNPSAKTVVSNNNDNNNNINVNTSSSKEISRGTITSVEAQVQEISGELFVINLTEEEESEEGIVVEWLLGTCLTYKSVRNLVIQNEKKEDNDVLFVESREIDYIDNVTAGNNFVQVGA
ncbi:149_t:CDS:2 [Entrophospora sp. SA101]|nr:805_t:CDS:2 [Entrophospora sp. SA101]CAJ0747417.1 149_t:CDS:2 [Entrophospora sp. SA101]